MKDGLMTPARVEELVSKMKEEKPSEVKNIGETANQWFAVANILAARENRDSLDQFIRLDGLYLLDQWLREAQNYSNYRSDGSVVESIGKLLGALKQLPVGLEGSDTSGIRATVDDLSGHRSSRIQEGERTPFENSNHGGENDADQQDIVKEACDSEVKTTDATLAVDTGFRGHCPVEGSADEDKHVAKPVGGDLQHSSSSEGPSESLKAGQIPASSYLDASHTTLSSKDEDVDQRDPQALSVMSTPCQKTVSTIKESYIDPEGVIPIVTCHSLDPMASNVEDMSSDVPELKDFTKDAKETDSIICSPDKISEKKMFSVSSTFVPEPHSSSSDRASALQSVIHSDVLSPVDAKEREFSPKKTIPIAVDEDSSTLAFNPKNEVVDCGVPKHLSSKVEIKPSAQAGGCYSNALQDLSINCCILSKPEDRETTFSWKEGTGAVYHGQELAGESISKGRGEENFATTRDISNSIVNTKLSDMVDKSRLDMELDFMVDDALEVATQVAKEVEREVVDYREPFCSSSSEKNSEGGLLQPSSPDSINGEQLQSVIGPLTETPTGQNLPGGPKGEDGLTSLKNMDEPRDCIHDQDLSQVTAAAQEPEGNIWNSICDFDLNEEVSSDEVDHRRTPNSPPVKFVSASKAPTSELAAEPPLQFEEEQGSKMSASTSVLCPASSCRTLDGEKALLVECNESLKQRQDFRDIDLNVTEGDDSVAMDLVVEKQIPVSSGLLSGESSIEVSSRKADRIELDLNRNGDSENAPSSDWRTEGRFPFHHLDGHRSSSSSSSSSRQPSMRNIDLNDNPYLCESQEMNAHGGFELDDPVISIMGTRVVVNRKEFLPQSWSFLPNGQVASSPMDVNFTRSGDAVGAPPATSVSLSSAMYGPSASIPFVVDSRGTPVAPEMIGSMTGVPSSYSQPILSSMTSPPSPPYGVGPRRPILDLNLGVTVAEGESSESGGLRQLFVPGQGAVMEEQRRANLEPSSSGLGLKRSEPDAGWDVYPINFKQQSPWR